MKSLLERSLIMLKELQWIPEPGYEHSECRECGATDFMGHRPHCEIKKLIDEIEKMMEVD